MWFEHEDDEQYICIDVVFCVKCKYFNGNNHYCDFGMHVTSDDFCSKGEEWDDNN